MKKILSLLFCLLPLAGFAAEGVQLRFRHLTTGEGLPSNCVRALCQDHMGLLWIGTGRGLCRYDGIQFSSPLGNDVSVAITFLYDRGSEMLVGSSNGLYVYDFQTDSLRHSTLRIGEFGQDVTAQITYIGEDQNQNLWIGTLGQGILYLQKGADRLEQFLDPHSNISCMLIDSENQVWALSNHEDRHNLSRYNKSLHCFEEYKLQDKNGKTVPTNGRALYEDANHHLWLGTYEDGLICFDAHSREARQAVKASEAPLLHIYSIFQYDEHRLLIGSNEGLYMYNMNSGEGQVYKYSDADPRSITNQFVCPIMRDREGGLWVGTYFGGLNYVHPRTGAFVVYKTSSSKNSLSGLVISSMIEDEERHIWFGSNDGGLSVFSPETGLFETIHLEEHSRLPHNVTSLALRKNEVWVGTYTTGIDVYNRTTHAVRHYPELYDDLDNDVGGTVYSLLADDRNRIWVGTDKGVCLYSDQTDRFNLVKSFDVRLNKIVQFQDSLLWVATQGEGIWRYNLNTQEWRQFKNRKIRNSYNQAYDLRVDAKGRLWAGTLDGLLCYRPDLDNFVREDLPFDRIPDIQSIAFDGATMWLGSSFGLIHYSPSGFADDPSSTARTYTRGDGLSCRNLLPGSCLMSSDGRLYFGTSRGVNAFFPHQLRHNKVVPNVFFTKLEVYNNQSVLVSRPEFQKNLNIDNRIELNYQENEITVWFAAPSYCQPNKNHYAYWLEGFDKHKSWNYIENDHKAIYTNLRPGRYVLHVKASNNDKVWDDKKEARLEIIIQSPFYWNFYSVTLYGLLFFAAMWVLLRYQRKHTELKHQLQMNKIRQENDQKIQDAKIRFFTAIAHEIRTPVSLITAPLQKILKDPQSLPMSTRADLNVINSNSQRLLVLVNQLLDFRKIEDGSAFYRFRPTSLRPLLQSVTGQFEASFAEKRIQFEVTYPDADYVVCIDREAMTKLVSNLLSNARKYARKYVSLKCMDRGDKFVLEVHNDGESISKNDQIKIFRPFYQTEENKPGTGLGLSIVKGVVDAFEGEIKVNSEPGEGTTFIITIPSNLPASAEEETPDTERESGDPVQVMENKDDAADRPTLLIVDDNEEMLNFLTESLKDDYRILTAGNGRQALKVLEQQVVSFIVSDWMMPELDGEQFCLAVRRNPLTSHIPFIMLTAKTDDESKVKGMDCGVDLFIEKPFSLDFLQASIRNLLKMRKKLTENFNSQPLESIEKLTDIPADQAFLNQLEKLIEDNFANADLSIDFLCRELGMSRSSFFNKIRALVDVSPNQMIQLIRLKHAARLLKEGRHTIGEVCYMVGFSNSSYFAKCFQKQFGKTPSEFVELQKEL